MASKEKRRRDRLRYQQQRIEQPEATVEPDKPTWEKRLEERAVRERWPMPPEMRVKILGRLMEIIDPESGTSDIMLPTHRDVNAAAKTLLMADRMNMEEQKIVGAKVETTTDAEAPKRIVIPDVDDRLAPRED